MNILWLESGHGTIGPFDVFAKKVKFLTDEPPRCECCRQPLPASSEVEGRLRWKVWKKVKGRKATTFRIGPMYLRSLFRFELLAPTVRHEAAKHGPKGTVVAFFREAGLNDLFRLSVFYVDKQMQKSDLEEIRKGWPEARGRAASLPTRP